MEYLVRFAQVHETFRKPELEALAVVANVELEIITYNSDVRLINIFLIPLRADIVIVSLLYHSLAVRRCRQSSDLQIHPRTGHIRTMGVRARL
jgi:tRNA G10  N-methylase Trm11